MDIGKIRKSSYIYRLYKQHYKELVNFLRENGYLPRIIYDEKKDKAVPPIEMYYDKKKTRYEIIYRCQNTNNDEKTQIANSFSNKSFNSMLVMIMGFMGATSSGFYCDDSTMLYITDYYISDYFVRKPNEHEFANKYVNFMYGIFGEQYKKDCLKFHSQKNGTEQEK